MSPSTIATNSALTTAAVVARVAHSQHQAVDADELLHRLHQADVEPTLDGIAAAVVACGLDPQRRTIDRRRFLESIPRLAPVFVDDGVRVMFVSGTTGPWWRRRPEGQQLSSAGAGPLRALDINEAIDTLDVVTVDHQSAASALGSVHHASPMSRVRQLLSLERRDIAAVVVYGVILAMLSLATPLAVSALVSSIAFSNLLQPLVVLSVLLAVALVAGGAIRAMQYAVVEYLQRRLFVRLVADLAWRLPRVAPAEREKRDTTKFVNRFFDVVTAQKVLPTLLIDGTTLALELTVGLALLAAYHPVMVAFAAFLFLGVLGVLLVLGRGGVRSSIDESYAKHDVAGWLEELSRNPTVFRDPTARQFGKARADQSTRIYLEARARHFRVLLRQAIGAFALQAVAAVSLLVVGGILVMNGTLNLGQLVAAELIVGAVTAGFLKLHKQIESAYDLLASVDKIGALVDLGIEPEIDDKDGIMLQPSEAFAVAATAVQVTPHSAPITFSLPAGGGLAILEDTTSEGVGRALVACLQGISEASAGHLTVGGHEVHLVTSSSLRARLQVVRHPEIIEGSLSENLRVGQSQASTSELVEALRVVELDDLFLAAGQGGLGQALIPGSRLAAGSVGQRLMVARALVASPAVLVLDGALDGLAPAQATRLLKRLQGLPMTLIVRTNDPSLAEHLPHTVQWSNAPQQTLNGDQR